MMIIRWELSASHSLMHTHFLMPRRSCSRSWFPIEKYQTLWLKWKRCCLVKVKRYTFLHFTHWGKSPEFITKFTFWKSHFWQNSHFQSLIFSQNSHFKSIIFDKIHIFQPSNSREFLDEKLHFVPVWFHKKFLLFHDWFGGPGLWCTNSWDIVVTSH